MEPTDPIASTAHRNPYFYYRSLLEGPPLFFHNELRMWIAAHASSVSQTFADPACRVRPAAEPIPAALDGRPSGETFKHLVRMNDGDRHDRPKSVLKHALDSISVTDLLTRARQAAETASPVSLAADALTTWVYETPVTVVADLLGLPANSRSDIASDVKDFVACLTPLSTPEQLNQADSAALRLRFRIQNVIHEGERRPESLMSRIFNLAHDFGWTEHTSIVANLIGLLSQTYEATAGLIGNSIVTLASQPHLLDEVRARKDGWQQLVHETSRYESPVQNTRRFVVAPTVIGGIELRPGATILLVLAAANRDERENLEPARFLLHRTNRRVFTFSRGSHACPGEALARQIAASALSTLNEILSAQKLAELAWTWRPSINSRLPMFKSA